MKTDQKKQGFTLIELLIVIAVIAILAALAIPNLISSRKGANETSAIASMRTIITSEEGYRSRNLSGTNSYGKLLDLETKGLMQWPTAGTYQKSGYLFTDIATTTPTTDWGVWATPNGANIGDRDFAATVDGFVRSQAVVAAAGGDATPADTGTAQKLPALQ